MEPNPAGLPLEGEPPRTRRQWLGIGCGTLIAFIVILAVLGSRTGTGQATPTPTVAVAVATAVPTPTTAPTATSAATAAVASVPTPLPTPTPVPPTPTKPPTPTPVPPTPTPAYTWGLGKGDVHVSLADGQVGQIKDPNGAGVHQVTVVKVTDPATSSNQFEQPAAGKRYVTLQVIVANTGSAPVYSGSWKLRATDGFEYDDTFASGLGDPLNLTQLSPGGKTQGTVVFEVAVGAKIQYVRYQPNTFENQAIYFDAKP